MSYKEEYKKIDRIPDVKLPILKDIDDAIDYYWSQKPHTEDYNHFCNILLDPHHMKDKTIITRIYKELLEHRKEICERYEFLISEHGMLPRKAADKLEKDLKEVVEALELKELIEKEMR